MSTVTRTVTRTVTPDRTPDRTASGGTLPAALDGTLWLAGGGIRLVGGAARWVTGHGPGWSGARVLAGGAGPDEVGGAAVAHPVADPSGQWHTVVSYPGLGLGEVLRLGEHGEVRQAEPFALGGAPLVHAVARVGEHTVVFDLPVLPRPGAAVSGAAVSGAAVSGAAVSGAAVSGAAVPYAAVPYAAVPYAAVPYAAVPYAWRAGRPARIGLLGRPGEPPAWFGIAPCYVFNVVNAFRDGHQVVVDAVRHERAFDPAGRPARPRLWRWVLDPRDGSVQERALAASPQEWPAIDPRWSGRRHRYVFTTALAGDGSAAPNGGASVGGAVVGGAVAAVGEAGGNGAAAAVGGNGGGAAGVGGGLVGIAVVRHDLATGEVLVRRLWAGCAAGRPVFVPRPGAAGGRTGEGDGWLLVVVPGRLLVLDATDLTPVAAVPVPGLRPGPDARWQAGR